MLKFLKNLFGDSNEAEINRIREIVEDINGLEPQFTKLSDASLQAKTWEFKQRLEKGEEIQDLLPEAFATVREASRRILGMRHFDVQLIGGVVLHEGKISEMKTGEGKTLVATLPSYLNALTGKGVHIVTVNEYLARRDSEWMGRIHRFLGLTVGLIAHGIDYPARRAAYAADITYGTNNEFGFDFLRDNMVIDVEHMVQRHLSYAIVDEVDSILIDEARTPLIISGPGEKGTELYYDFARLMSRMADGEDFTVDEKAHSVAPTETGIAKAEKFFNITNLYDEENVTYSHHLNQALKAHYLMKRDRDYVVKEGEVVIVDEFTGRLMFGRRYSDGLHQAIEAKEGVKIERESMTLATITFQNYFRMYEKLAGMTGTAMTEAEEFRKIYGLDVIAIPPNKPMIREDLPDVIYKTQRAKYNAVVQEIVQRHGTGQPMLVGTTSIEKSETLSKLLQKKGIPHTVLNAKFHEKEAEIVAKAGQKGAVTIATNMAGRGTDIVLGDGVPALGGLHIVGTERHESRRIDNQLRGRAGRQGDPGSSRFYLSLEDDLMRLFGSDNIAGIMDRLGMEEDEPIEHALITKSIETAQKRVEGRNFDIRKQILEYDDVANQQREVIYSQRRKILFGEEVTHNIFDMVDKIVGQALDLYCDEKVYPEEWDYEGLVEYLEEYFAPKGYLKEDVLNKLGREELREELQRIARDIYAQREKELGSATMRDLEKVVMLKVVDQKWLDHIDAMDNLRQGIGLRAYGQKNPLMEYKFEAFEMFNAMIENIQEDIVRFIYHVKVGVVAEDHLQEAKEHFGDEEDKNQQPIRNKDDIGRNELCPCGSGKKYKKCCGSK